MRAIGLLGITYAMLTPGAIAQDGGGVVERLGKLDAKLLTALSELATLFDGKKDPEATHFFCECAMGFGNVDDRVKALKKKWEDECSLSRYLMS